MPFLQFVSQRWDKWEAIKEGEPVLIQDAQFHNMRGYKVRWQELCCIGDLVEITPKYVEAHNEETGATTQLYYLNDLRTLDHLAVKNQQSQKKKLRVFQAITVTDRVFYAIR